MGSIGVIYAALTAIRQIILNGLLLMQG